MRHLPPLAAVRVFEAAARHLNFTAAGAELGMTQSAVSYQVRLLEERLRLPLFERARGRVALTPAARRIAPMLAAAFDMLADAFAGLRADDDAVLRISAPNTFAARWLAPRIGGFQLCHPELAVQLDATDRLVDFTRDEVDVAIRVAQQPGPGLHGDRLFATSFVPMASPAFVADHPLATPADLLQVARLSPGDVWWSSWFRSVGVVVPDGPAPGLRLDSQVIEAAAAMAGAGVAILSPRLWAREVAEGRLAVPFDRPATTGSQFWLVCAGGRRHLPKISAFRTWLLAEAAAG